MARIGTAHPYFTPQSIAGRSASPRGFALNFSDSRTLAGMLLAAILAALLVVADQVIDTWADGHLLAVWVALWTVIFAAMAFSARSLRQTAEAVVMGWTQWVQNRATRHSDAALLRLAREDHRVMRDLQAAMTRSEYEA